MFQTTILTAAVMALTGTPGDTLRTQQLDEVVVTHSSARQRLQSLQVGAEQLQLKELTAAPSLLGEGDVIRSLQMLPGVKAENEASSSFQVRGGTSAQNVILYDQAPVYNVGHLAGLLSAFNDDALGSATLYKGLLPAQFGGASSAVLDISSRGGSREGWHGGATVGLLSAKAGIEGPLTDKVSVLLCGRRSYADMFLKMFDDYKDNTLYFYDMNARADWQAGEHDQLQWSMLVSNDKTALKDMVSLRWRNLATSLTWRHQFLGGAYSQTALILSNYTTDNGVDLLGMDLTFSGHIRQTGLYQNFTLPLGSHTERQVGGQSMLMDVKSAEWQQISESKREQRRAWENTLWAGAAVKLSPRLSAQAGLRLTAFSSLGGPYYYEVDEQGDIVWFYKTRKNRIVYTHWTLDPRLSVVWQPTRLLSVKAGYTRTAQNLHALRGQNTSTPFDRYTMSSNLLKPQKADQVSLGLFGMTDSQDYDFSAEGYYRHIENILDYRDGKSFSSEIEMERLVLPGKGRCYGVELMGRKNTGRLTGWLSYALSWSENKIAGINGGRWYTASNDRRHDIGIVGIYRLSAEWLLSGLWTFNSGQAFTAPSGKYEMIDNYIYYYAERNGYRAPDYHRLDVSATWTRAISRSRLTRVWTFGIYNLYNRYNPFLINFEDSSNGARTKAVQYSMFGIVPSVSFTIKF